MTEDNGNTLRWRVEQLETCNRETSAKLDSILNNHLPHIQEQITLLNERFATQNRLAYINITAIIGLIGAVLFAYINHL